MCRNFQQQQFAIYPLQITIKKPKQSHRFASASIVSLNFLTNKLQRAKKVVSDSPGLVDFAIGLIKSVFNLPDGQVMFFEEFE